MEHHYSLRSLQSLLGVSRRVLTGLVDAGFVTPARGPRNELRFSFQDVVLLRTAYQLQSANIPSRKILRSLTRLRASLPQELPLTGIRITAVGNTIAVRLGPDQWDADSGQLLLDFEVAPLKGDVAFLDSSPRSAREAHIQAEEWFELGEELTATDRQGAERAYRKGLQLLPVAHYGAYTNLGVLLCEDGRCEEALTVFDRALEYFPEDCQLHFNRAVALEELNRGDDALDGYKRCLKLAPEYADAHYNLARLNELRGDKQGALRHYNAYRRLQEH
ncbi:tetratricopeptide repeat protein [Cupriavidus necator]|uniref:tetratricopeptide repeat protein n=1 Tax=Cupriavidus necator TaxID=106590 RepID=UPI003C6C0CC8